MSSIIVSIVIPVYNVEDFLRECLESIVHQTYKNIEILLIDDGSTDNSGVICDQYSKNFSNVSTYHKKNGGLSSARNYGLERASGEWILFVDSDDWCNLNYIEKLLKCLDENEEIDVILSSCYVQQKSGDFILRYHTFHDEGLYDIVEQVEAIQALTFSCMKYSKKKWLEELDEQAINAAPWDKLYRMDIIRKNNIYFREKTKVYEDSLFNVDYFKYVKKAYFVDARGYYYRYVDSGITKKIDLERLKKKEYYLLCIEEFSNELKQNKFMSDSLNQMLISETFETIRFISLLKNRINKLELRKMCLDYMNSPVFKETRRKLRIKSISSKYRIIGFLAKINSYRLMCIASLLIQK